MALERPKATQLVSWKPPRPQRAFRILSAGQTTDDMLAAGFGTDGKRYGYLVLDTSQWVVAAGFHAPPVEPGEKFQLWTSGLGSGTVFPYPPMFQNGNAYPLQNVLPAEFNTNPANGAPDLFSVYSLTQSREANGSSPAYLLKDGQLCTVQNVQQSSSGAWYVYYSPYLGADTISPTNDGIITVPQLRDPRPFGRIGHVSSVNYSWSVPGGPDQLTWKLQTEPNYRDIAMDVGRTITAQRGCSCIWEGTLIEPQPTPTGWELTANGCGTYGTNLSAWWEKGVGPTPTSSGWFPDGPVDYAISRGLRWTNRGIGKPAGIFTGPKQDAGSLTITDFLNLLCTGGALTWELLPPASAGSWPPGPWELAVYPMPTDQSGNPLVSGPPWKVQVPWIITWFLGWRWHRLDLILSRPRRPPDLYVVNTNPVARTIANTYNTIVLKYERTPDVTATSTKKAQTATFQTTFVDSPSAVAAQGRVEYYLDISNAGAMTATQAAAIGLNVLNKYIRVNFSNPFTVQPGQLLNTGGVPVDLGLNWAGHVATLQVQNAAMGGEVGFAPLTFYIGQYEYDDDTETATITPYQNSRTDIASVIASLYPGRFA